MSSTGASGEAQKILGGTSATDLQSRFHRIVRDIEKLIDTNDGFSDAVGAGLDDILVKLHGWRLQADIDRGSLHWLVRDYAEEAAAIHLNLLSLSEAVKSFAFDMSTGPVNGHQLDDLTSAVDELCTLSESVKVANSLHEQKGPAARVRKQMLEVHDNQPGRLQRYERELRGQGHQGQELREEERRQREVALRDADSKETLIEVLLAEEERFRKRLREREQELDHQRMTLGEPMESWNSALPQTPRTREEPTATTAFYDKHGDSSKSPESSQSGIPSPLDRSAPMLPTKSEPDLVSLNEGLKLSPLESTGKGLRRPQRRYEKFDHMYKCGWNGCEKTYSSLNHLNAHVTMQSHGQKRSPEEFQQIRKEWKAHRKMEEELARRADEERRRQTTRDRDTAGSRRDPSSFYHPSPALPVDDDNISHTQPMVPPHILSELSRFDSTVSGRSPSGGFLARRI